MKKTIIGAIIIAVMASVSMAATVTNIAENARYTPNTNYYANQAVIGNGTVGTNLTTISGGASLKAAGGTINSEGVLVFKLPVLPAGHEILTADLKATSYRSWETVWNIDLYGVRSNSSSSAVTTNDYGAYCANASGTKIMDNWLTTNDTNVTWFTHSLSSGACVALKDWLKIQYNSVGAGGYVFLRFQPDSVSATNDANAYNVAGAANTNTNYTPVLTITTQPVSKTNICYTVFKHCNVLAGSTNKVESPSDLLKTGRSSALSAGVLVFELPDLHGASVVSANLKFRVVTNANRCGVNINIDAIRGGPRGAAVKTNDFLGIGNPVGTCIQTDAVIGTNPVNYTFYTSTNANATLAAWLTGQYTNGSGGCVFLRLTPDADPGVNSRYIGVSASSAELTIVTDGNESPVSGCSSNVSVKMGSHNFSWTFNQPVEWGYFIDGQPWVVAPASDLYLESVSPARSNNALVYLYYPNTNGLFNTTNADIHITVKNPPVDHLYDQGGYLDDTNGVFGWDGRPYGNKVTHPKYNGSLGWDGVAPLLLQVGDSITTPLSITNVMTDRSTRLEALAVLTVLSSKPPLDAFRPGIFRSGDTRTSPEIICYSDIITNLSLIACPTNGSPGLTNMIPSSIADKYSYAYLRDILPGPGFINTGYGYSEGCSAFYNNSSWLVDSDGSSYGGYIGVYIGRLAVGSLAGWLTEDERRQCRIRMIQRAIDTYSAVKEGLCLEEGAGVLPGYSTLITLAGVMLNNTNMMSVNNGVNGVKPWWIFADYATTFHTDGVSTNDLASGELPGDRLISLYVAPGTSTNDYPRLNKANVTAVTSTTTNTMTMANSFYWDYSRPACNVINLKMKVTSGTGYGSTIYVITAATNFMQLNTNTMTYVLDVNGDYGGRLTVKPAWADGNGVPPTSASTLAFSVTTSSADKNSDNARWLWAVNGIVDTGSNPHIEKARCISSSPLAEYADIHIAGTVGNLIALYTLGATNIYKGGVDKWMIDAGTRPGYGEVLFGSGGYFDAIADNFLGALWKQQVAGTNFIYTGNGTADLVNPPNTAKMWYEQ